MTVRRTPVQGDELITVPLKLRRSIKSALELHGKDTGQSMSAIVEQAVTTYLASPAAVMVSSPQEVLANYASTMTRLASTYGSIADSYQETISRLGGDTT